METTGQYVCLAEECYATQHARARGLVGLVGRIFVSAECADGVEDCGSLPYHPAHSSMSCRGNK